MKTRSIAGSGLVLVAAALLVTLLPAQQKPEEAVQEVTRKWLNYSSIGDRTGLNSIMDPALIATVPGGDLLTKEQLVPDDLSQDLQKLPAFDVEEPTVRVYKDTAVEMARLKARIDPSHLLNATFIYVHRSEGWKLVAVHLSPQKQTLR